MRATTFVLSMVFMACSSAAPPGIDDGLGSAGRNDPSIVVGKVITLNIDSGVLTVDVRTVNGQEYVKRGVRVAAGGGTIFSNHTSNAEIERLTQIPGTIVEIEGYNDNGVYRAFSIAVIEIPPNHPVWQPYTK